MKSAAPGTGGSANCWGFTLPSSCGSRPVTLPQSSGPRSCRHMTDYFQRAQSVANGVILMDRKESDPLTSLKWVPIEKMVTEDAVNYRVLTVNREFGSGADRIAQKIAEWLGWKLLDRDIIDAIAYAAHVDASVV